MEKNDLEGPAEPEGAEPEQVPITDAQKQDLDRRLASLDSNPRIGSTWEKVKARLLGES